MRRIPILGCVKCPVFHDGLAHMGFAIPTDSWVFCYIYALHDQWQTPTKNLAIWLDVSLTLPCPLWFC